MAPSRGGVEQRAERERAGGERAEPIDVPADGARHEKGAEQSQRVEQRADAKRALLGFQRQADDEDGGERRVEGRADERLRAAFREDDGEDGDRDQRREHQRPRARSRRPVRRGDAPRERAEREERARDGARERRQDSDEQRLGPASPLCQHERAEPQREAEIERNAAGEQRDAGARREEEGAGPRGAGREATRDRELEQRRRGDHRDGCEQCRTDRGSQRGRDDRVGGQVVAAVPAVVPDREAEAREEVAAVAGGGQVGALGSEDQIGDRQQRGERPRRRPAQHRGELARRRGGRSGLRAHPSLRKVATRSTMSGRSSHPQCPASGYSASSPCGSAAA